MYLMAFILLAVWGVGSAAAGYGNITVLAMTRSRAWAVGNVALDGGTCSAKELAGGPYSVFLSRESSRVYGVNASHVLTYTTDGAPVRAVPFENPGQGSYPPAFWVEYNKGDHIFGWRQTSSRPYTYVLHSVDTITGETARFDNAGCAVPGSPFVQEGDLLWMYKQDCSFAASHMYKINATNGTVAGSYGLPWFTVYSMVLNPSAEVYALACTDNNYASVFKSSTTPYTSYSRLPKAPRMGCYSVVKPSGLALVGGGSGLVYTMSDTDTGRTTALHVVDTTTGNVTRNITTLPSECYSLILS